MQQIHFVTGKGGVGKSLVAAALARQKSREGLKTLLVEMGDQSFFKDYFELTEVGFKPQELRENLDISIWSGQESLREYARYLIKVESLYKIFFENTVMKALINIAPALPELAIMGKITSGPRQHGPPMPYECLVIDSFATGHFMALMRAAPGMLKAVQFGPMGEQSRAIEKVLKDPNICHYHVVTLPEELPLKEASELIGNLKDEFGIESELILNRLLQSDLSAAELAKMKISSKDLKSFAEYLSFHLSKQEEIEKRAKKMTYRFKRLPLLLDSDPWATVDLLADLLEAQ